MISGAVVARVSRVLRSFQLSLALFVALGALGGCAERGAFGPPTLEPLELSFGEEWIRDRRGRVVLLRGATYTASETGMDLGGFGGPGEHALATMERLGMNVVRLPLSWAKIEPQPGRRSTQYIHQRVDPIVRLAAAHGMAVLLSMRPWPRGPCEASGSTIPTWVCDVTAAARDPSCAFWRTRGPDEIPLRHHYAGTWSVIAAHYAQDARVVGFDVLDQPSGGTCFSPAPFEAGHLLPYYDQLARKIRRSGARQALLVEPPTRRLGLRVFEKPPSGPIVFAPQIWTERFGPPTASEASVARAYDDAGDAARRIPAPLFIGSIGGNLSPAPGTTRRRTSPAFLRESLAQLDQHLIGGAFYGLHPKSDEDPGIEIDAATRAVLERPYARRIAGIPSSMSFDPSTLEFELQFTDDPDRRPPDPTEIYLPVRLYGEAPVVTVEPKGSSRFDIATQRLLIYRGSGSAHEVRVRPSGGPQQTREKTP